MKSKPPTVKVEVSMAPLKLPRYSRRSTAALALEVKRHKDEAQAESDALAKKPRRVIRPRYSDIGYSMFDWDSPHWDGEDESEW